MKSILANNDITRMASIELNLLNYSRSLPSGVLEGVRLAAGTPIHDINGTVLFHRIPLGLNGVTVGYADVAAHTAFGEPLLAVAPSMPWEEQVILAAAREAFLKWAPENSHKAEYDEVRLVAYSYPKIAVQFLRKNREVIMLECFSWTRVPPAPKALRRKALRPSNFERWSLLNELPRRKLADSHKAFQRRFAALSSPALRNLSEGVVLSRTLSPIASVLKLTSTYEIHYSRRTTDHHVCYELRGQETNVWCVGASTQMVLDFYRYNYTQTRIAQALGLGTPSNPNGLSYARVGDVVTQLQALSSNALTAHMITSPSFLDFTSEIIQNRPMISFIPGHSRTVAGFTESLLSILKGQIGFRGLLVYDPWPPNAGVITRWENYNTQTYQYAFTARVSTI